MRHFQTVKVQTLERCNKRVIQLCRCLQQCDTLPLSHRKEYVQKQAAVCYWLEPAMLPAVASAVGDYRLQITCNLQGDYILI
jgi:hypothetical protein